MKHRYRIFAITLVLIFSFCVTASAQAPTWPQREGDNWPERAQGDCENCPEQTQPSSPSLPVKPSAPNTPPPSKGEPAPSKPLTPEGNMNKVDDQVSHSDEDKQFITVTTRDGSYFYIIIDRSNNGEPSVHFLNQVDAEDLKSIIDHDPADCICKEKCIPGEVNTNCPVCSINLGDCTAPEPEIPVCICTEQCQIGSVNAKCPVCSMNLGDCAAPEPELPVEPAPPVPDEPEPKSHTNPAAIVCLIAIFAGGGFFALQKLKKRKEAPIARHPDDYDLDDMDDEPWESEDSDETENEQITK